MQRRRRFKQIQSLEERLAEIAKRLREEAKSLPQEWSAKKSSAKPGKPKPART
ncbi:hypothetical protein [Bradyrhizobium diazoefficiens]|jgi:DNA repair exonuclease SbcCD ATPase subunit|uniref:hypothetical protein n=1 Tax=Bradyrhizobium diazoefficiens TaxID=1355477 RepID=UPI003D3145B4